MKKALLWFISGAASLCVCSLICYLGEQLDLWWRNYDSFVMFPFMALSMIALCAAGLATLFFTPFCLVVSLQSAYNTLKQNERFKQWL
jgi:hypothetical protein